MDEQMKRKKYKYIHTKERDKILYL